MVLSSLFGLKKPESTDPATVGADIGANAQITEDALKHAVAVQTNVSTTAFLTDLPLVAYVNDHSFIFIPTVDNSGAVTINVNSLGTKKIMSVGGTQISAAKTLTAYGSYLLKYSAAADGGLGAFICYPVVPKGVVGNTYYKIVYIDYNQTGTIANLSLPSDAQFIKIEFLNKENATSSLSPYTAYGAAGDISKGAISFWIENYSQTASRIVTLAQDGTLSTSFSANFGHGLMITLLITAMKGVEM